MNSFGECPLFFFVDDDEMFEDIDSNRYWNNNYGKIVELSDVGCDAKPPLSLSSRDAKQRDPSHLKNRDVQHEHLKNTRCSRGDSQTIKNGARRTGNDQKKRNTEEKSGRRKSRLAQDIYEVDTDSIRRENESKRKTRMRNHNDGYFVLEEVPLPPETPLDFIDIQNHFVTEEMYTPQRTTRTTRGRTNPKIPKTEGKRSKLKLDHLYERYRQKPGKLINEPSLYKDYRDSVFFHEDYMGFKNCAVDNDSLSSLSKCSETSMSSESSKEYSKDNFLLRGRGEEQNTVVLNKFEDRKKHKQIKKNYVKSNLVYESSSEECDQNPNKKLNRVNGPKENSEDESNISNHSVGVNGNVSKNEAVKIKSPAQEDKEQISKKLKDLFNSYSVKKKASLTKSTNQESQITLKSGDKKMEMDSVEVKKEDSSIASTNSTLSAAKRKRSRLPIRIGGSIKTKFSHKNENSTSSNKSKQTDQQSEKTDSIKIKNSEAPTEELNLDMNKNPEVDKKHNSMESPKLVTKSPQDIVKNDMVSEGTTDDSKNSSKKNKQEEIRSRINFSSKWQEVHFQRRAVDLKVFNMAKAAREQRKREFAEYGFEETKKGSEEEPQEILDIGISLVEKNLQTEMPRHYSTFEKPQSNIPGIKILSRRGSIYS